jgi:diaminopimelate decarboxylase
MVDLIRAGGLFPDTAEVGATGRLMVGGCELSGLAERFGTPLYVYDEAGIRGRARAYRSELERGYAGQSRVCYAAKAYCAPWLLAIMAEEGIGLDVVSGGELYAAATVAFPMDRAVFHGNNKSNDELVSALELGIGRIVLDNLDEIRALGALSDARRVRQPVLLGLAPGVDAHTHEHVHTGGLDTKFGLGIHTGQAAAGAGPSWPSRRSTSAASTCISARGCPTSVRTGRRSNALSRSRPGCKNAGVRNSARSAPGAGSA